MVKKILNAASWLSMVQVMNMLSVIVLSIFVIRRSGAAEVSAYMYAVFLTDAVMSYTLLQIAQRITLAKDDTAFRQLFAYSRRFGLANAALAVLVVLVFVAFSDEASRGQTLSFIAWLTAAGLANYFASLCFSVCDYTFDYKSFGLSSALSNVVSLGIAVTVFAFDGGIFSMVVRDVARAFILFALALYSTRSLLPQLRGIEPLVRKERAAFLGFLVKRHTLKVIEVSNHRVPALVMSSGNVTSLGQFGVAFQLISQIMNVLTIVGDKLAYAFFARGERTGKLKYLGAVLVIYALTGLLVFVFGKPLFALIYGPRWIESATIFSWLGMYIFTHGTLVVVTNYLITEHRFAGVYLSWAGWTMTFAACYFFDRSWPIAGYYIAASLVAAVLVLGALLVSSLRGRATALPGQA
jgi:O-antigen/teichoic acid export membrane protein